MGSSTCVSFICVFVFILVGSASCGVHNQVCPFNYEFHSGDGFFDVGNAAQAYPRPPVNNWPYECRRIMEDSIFIFGDVEANDIGIPLSQGKSIEDVRNYTGPVTRASIRATKELISMGATRIIQPGNAPIGCFPYLLTKFANSSEEYDEYGCLKRVNDVIKYKNGQLRRAVEDLQKSYPHRYIIFADVYDPFIEVINGSLNGPYKENTLKACCGSGGKYNYDSKKFCGTSSLVPVCDDPQNYIHWDGKHLTQNAHLQLNTILKRGPSEGLNCTMPGPPNLQLFSSI